SGVTHCHTMRRAASCRAPRGGSVCVGTTSNGSCAADPCGSLASTPAVNTTAIQCCHTVDGGTAMCQVKPLSACLKNGGTSMGPGTCSPNPCATTTTTSSTTTTHAPTTTTTSSTTTTTT